MERAWHIAGPLGHGNIMIIIRGNYDLRKCLSISEDVMGGRDVWVELVAAGVGRGTLRTLQL